MKEFLLFCSGANTDVLKECPTDESKYVGIGATIVLTALLASLSGGYALFTVFGSVPVAIVFGIVWGVVIFNLDRVIVSGMRRQKHVWMDVMYALPRLILSVLLAVVISRPLELRLFEAELLREWSRMQLEERNRDVEKIQSEKQDQLKMLEAENTALKRDIKQQEAEFQQAQEAWIREKAGTGDTGVPGAGPVFAERQTAKENAFQQWEEAKTTNQSRIARNDILIAQIRNEWETREKQVPTVRDGLLARMEAFGKLKEEPTVHLASLFITLLFISLETAPVMVKLLSTFSPYRPYDELLEQREFEIVEQVRQNVRIRRHALKADAERLISDHSGAMEAEMHLSTERNQLRLNAELRANEALMEHIKDAQVEIAEVLVDEWKANELEKIVNGRGTFTSNAPSMQ